MVIHKEYEVWLKPDGRLDTYEQNRIAAKNGLDDPNRMPDMVVPANDITEARKKSKEKTTKRSSYQRDK